jgi:hypothetical protein
MDQMGFWAMMPMSRLPQIGDLRRPQDAERHPNPFDWGRTRHNALWVRVVSLGWDVEDKIFPY